MKNTPHKAGDFRFTFAYPAAMKISGYERQVNFSKLGTALLVSSCLVLAIRMGKWGRESSHPTGLTRELQDEIAFSAHLAHLMLRYLLANHASLFPSKGVPRWEPTAEDVNP